MNSRLDVSCWCWCCSSGRRKKVNSSRKQRQRQPWAAAAGQFKRRCTTSISSWSIQPTTSCIWGCNSVSWRLFSNSINHEAYMLSVPIKYHCKISYMNVNIHYFLLLYSTISSEVLLASSKPCNFTIFAFFFFFFFNRTNSATSMEIWNQCFTLFLFCWLII